MCYQFSCIAEFKHGAQRQTDYLVVQRFNRVIRISSLGFWSVKRFLALLVIGVWMSIFFDINFDSFCNRSQRKKSEEDCNFR